MSASVGGAGYRTLHPAARVESAISPRAALRYDVSPAVAARVSSGAGFRPPYLNELVRGFRIGATALHAKPGPSSGTQPHR